jgi:hypothetical protein
MYKVFHMLKMRQLYDLSYNSLVRYRNCVHLGYAANHNRKSLSTKYVVKGVNNLCHDRKVDGNAWIRLSCGLFSFAIFGKIIETFQNHLSKYMTFCTVLEIPFA